MRPELLHGIDDADVPAILRRHLVTSPDPEKIDRAREAAEWAVEHLTDLRYRGDVCLTIAHHYVGYSDFATAVRWIDRAEEIAGTDRVFRARILYTMAVVFNHQRQTQDALTALREAQTLVDENSDLAVTARIVTLLAACYDELGMITDAEDTYVRAIELRERLGDEQGLAVVYYNFAEMCQRRDEEEMAYEHFTRAYEIEKRLNLVTGMPRTACLLAIIHAARGDADRALELVREAIDMAERAKVPVLVAHCLANAAAVYERLGQDAENERMLREAIAYAEQFDFRHLLGQLFLNLGSALIKREQYDEAERNVDRSLEMVREYGYRYAEGHAQMMQGIIARERDDYERAIERLRGAAMILLEVKASTAYLDALAALARTYTLAGATKEAAEQLVTWVEHHREIHNEHLRDRISFVQRQHERERKAAEAEIYRLKNIELTDAMRQLQILNDELRDLAAEKDELMAIAAHDLRNPLGDLKGLLSYVVNHFDTLQRDDVLDLCRDMLTTTERLLATVHNFLEVSRTDRRGYAVGANVIDLTTITRRVVQRYQPRAEEKDITLVMGTERVVTALGDAHLTDAIIDNLISNAVKFSPTASTVTVNVREMGAFAMTSVVDHGPGISETDRTKLFTKFGRLSSKPTAGEESLGLGLYLSQRMAERMNGKIDVEATEGAGATFRLALPLHISKA
jgi:signal transduction histidine kinase